MTPGFTRRFQLVATLKLCMVATGDSMQDVLLSDPRCFFICNAVQTEVALNAVRLVHMMGYGIADDIVLPFYKVPRT